MQRRADGRHLDWRGRWKGETALCIASGPSLTDADIEAALAWREAAAGRRILVTNTTFRKVPTADVVFGFDYKWWKAYIDEVATTCPGARVTVTAQNVPGVTQIDRKVMPNFGNSGTGQIALAIFAGCSDIGMLAYDCQHGPNGEVHHHGNHPRGLGNALSMPRWPTAFQKLADHANCSGVRVVNCSRRTALTCFPKVDLDEFLHSGRAQRLVSGGH